MLLVAAINLFTNLLSMINEYLELTREPVITDAALG